MATTTPITAHCPICEKSHTIDAQTFSDFGRGAICSKCIKWGHIDFQIKHKMSCVPDCYCQPYVR